MRRARAGELVAGASALVLLVALFRTWWYEVPSTALLTAWEGFGVVDVLLTIVALLGIALAVSQVAGRGPALPVALGVVTTTLALAGTLLVLYRILNQPGPNDRISVQVGAYVGLLASLGVFLGAWLSLSDERPRPVDPPPPEPQRRP